ncbi:MAG: mechanosensitive ion channel domain-containing protein [Spongiibacteraceae bacterium]
MNENDLTAPFDVLASMLNVGTISLFFTGLLVIWLVNWCIRRMSESLMTRFPSRRFLIMQIRTLVSFILYIGGTVMLVSGVLNPPKEFLIAVAGSAAVALGFALKDVAASLVSGVILLFDRPFQVGDRVTFNDIYGEITAITLRSVRLQTLDDNIVTIPNARFITDVVSSGNMGMMDMMVVTDFHLALDADLEQAKDIVRQVIVTSRFAYLKKDVGFTMQEVEVAKRLAIRLRSMAYVFDVKYEKIFQSDITNRVTHLFREAEVKRPMSH